MAVGYQSFYQAQLTANISETDLTIPLDAAPIPSEGFLVIEGTVASKREIIYYISKTTTSVTCPADGRGYDGTTAVSHLQNAAVVMAPVAAMFTSLTDLFTTTPQGWTAMVPAISQVVANGNRSYTLTHASSIASVVSAGMRRRFTRTSASPITSFSLNGTNMYLNKTSPSGMTFTDDFVVSAWIKLTAYGATSQMIASRYNGTSGWALYVLSTGQVNMGGFNAGAANSSQITSYQSIPLNKWVHVTAQLDMSTFTATTTTSYVMVDGVNAPASVSRTGTNPTALIQAGNLEIGSWNGGLLPFGGKIAQVAIYNAKVTQATILASIDRGLTGSETSLISAYSGANTTDLNTTNANNLTAQNGAVSGYADAPFGNGGISSTLEYALSMSVSSDGLTEVVQCPEGCALPTTGGITASAYSTQANPWGWVSDKGRWSVSHFINASQTMSGNTAGTWYNLGAKIIVPIGTWELGYNMPINGSVAAGAAGIFGTLSTGNNTIGDRELTSVGYINATGASATSIISNVAKSMGVNLAAATDYYFNLTPDVNTTSLVLFAGYGSKNSGIIKALPSGL